MSTCVCRKKIDEEVVAKRKAFSALLETAVVDIEKARLEFEWAVERDLEIEMAKGAGMSGCVLKNAEVVKKKLKETVRDWVDLWIRHDEAQKFFAEIPPCADVNLATE